MDFFDLDNTVPVLSIPQLLLHPEFKKVVSDTYNKNVDGDSFGRSKYRTKKLFKFFYFYTSWKSPYFDKDEATRKAAALKASGFDSSYKLDATEKEALAFYESLNALIFPEIKILKTMKESLVLIERGSALQTKKLSEVVTNLENIEVTGDTAFIDNYNALTTLYNRQLNDLLNVGQSVKKLKEDIKAIEAEMKVQEADAKKMRGGAIKGNRMDPK